MPRALLAMQASAACEGVWAKAARPAIAKARAGPRRAERRSKAKRIMAELAVQRIALGRRAKHHLTSSRGYAMRRRRRDANRRAAIFRELRRIRPVLSRVHEHQTDRLRREVGRENRVGRSSDFHSSRSEDNHDTYLSASRSRAADSGRHRRTVRAD